MKLGGYNWQQPQHHIWVYSSQHFLKLHSSLIPGETLDCDPALLAVAKLQSEILQIWHSENKYLLVPSLQKAVGTQCAKAPDNNSPSKVKHMRKRTWPCVLCTQRRIQREDHPEVSSGLLSCCLMGNFLLPSPMLQTFNFHRNYCNSVLLQGLSVENRSDFTTT